MHTEPIWILLKQQTMSGSGISWAICKSAPRSRQITTPAPHHSVFYRPDALPAANQQCQSTKSTNININNKSQMINKWQKINTVYLINVVGLVDSIFGLEMLRRMNPKYCTQQRDSYTNESNLSAMTAKSIISISMESCKWNVQRKQLDLPLN